MTGSPGGWGHPGLDERHQDLPHLRWPLFINKVFFNSEPGLSKVGTKHLICHLGVWSRNPAQHQQSVGFLAGKPPGATNSGVAQGHSGKLHV